MWKNHKKLLLGMPNYNPFIIHGFSRNIQDTTYSYVYMFNSDTFYIL